MMDYDYLTSIISNYSNITSLSNQKTNALSGASYIKDAMNKMGQASSLSDATKSASLSSVLQAATLGNGLQGTSLTDALQNTSFSDVLQTALAASGVDEEMAEKLSDLAGAVAIKADENTGTAALEGITSGLATGLSTGIEGEAKTSLIMQNYLTAALMKDTLDNALSDQADFTSSLFQGLAIGSLGGNDNSSLSSF